MEKKDGYSPKPGNVIRVPLIEKPSVSVGGMPPPIFIRDDADHPGVKEAYDQIQEMQKCIHDPRYFHEKYVKVMGHSAESMEQYQALERVFRTTQTPEATIVGIGDVKAFERLLPGPSAHSMMQPGETRIMDYKDVKKMYGHVPLFPSPNSKNSKRRARLNTPAGLPAKRRSFLRCLKARCRRHGLKFRNAKFVHHLWVLHQISGGFPISLLSLRSLFSDSGNSTFGSAAHNAIVNGTLAREFQIRSSKGNWPWQQCLKDFTI